MKWLYRLEAIDKNNGLWYNSKNEYVWGCKDCKGEAKNIGILRKTRNISSTMDLSSLDILQETITSSSLKPCS